MCVGGWHRDPREEARDRLCWERQENRIHAPKDTETKTHRVHLQITETARTTKSPSAIIPISRTPNAILDALPRRLPGACGRLVCCGGCNCPFFWPKPQDFVFRSRTSQDREICWVETATSHYRCYHSTITPPLTYRRPILSPDVLVICVDHCL